eukprot:1147692-Pelagomonas_calceolata.AAC.1
MSLLWDQIVQISPSIDGMLTKEALQIVILALVRMAAASCRALGTSYMYVRTRPLSITYLVLLQAPDRQLVLSSPTPIYLYKVQPHAKIADNECVDAIAKHQAIQRDDTPADTTFPCVNLEDNPFHDLIWLAFEEAARSHASTSEHPDSPALKLKHFFNLHDALRTRMKSKYRLGKANTKTGYDSYYQNLLLSP